MKTLYLIGLMLFTTTYIGISLTTNTFIFILLFLLYGLYAAATEGISKAWISNITDNQNIATAIGTFTGFQSLCTMLASSLTGMLWFKLGASTALMFSAIGVIFVVVYLLIVVKPLKIKQND